VLARWIKANSPEAINSRELRRARVLSTKADMTRYEAAIAELEAAGWLRASDQGKGWGSGRHRKDWDVNPLVYGGKDG
jgi:hypothetical protein